eukprot:4241722-Pyramimonas_sp.AAC.1
MHERRVAVMLQSRPPRQQTRRQNADGPSNVKVLAESSELTSRGTGVRSCSNLRSCIRRSIAYAPKPVLGVVSVQVSLRLVRGQ